MGKRKNVSKPAVDVVSPSTPDKTTTDSSKVQDSEAHGGRVTRSRTKSGRVAAAHTQSKLPSPEKTITHVSCNDAKTGDELQAMARSMSGANPPHGAGVVVTPTHYTSQEQMISGMEPVVPKIENIECDVPSVAFATRQIASPSDPAPKNETAVPKHEAASEGDIKSSLQPTSISPQEDSKKKHVARGVIRDHSNSAPPSISKLKGDSEAAPESDSAPPHSPELKSGREIDPLAFAIASFNDDPSFWDQVVAMEERRESGAHEQPSPPARPDLAMIGPGNDRTTFNVSDADLQRKVWVNRAPVLSLWAAVVAQREGYTWQSALTFGRAIASNFAATKARKLGIKRSGDVDGEWEEVPVFGTFVSAKNTKEGVCAVQNGHVISVDSAQSYLQNAFSVNLPFAQVAMERLALCYEPRDIGSVAYKLYEDFRPGIPDGVQGWGAKGLLDLSKISAIIALVKTI